VKLVKTCQACQKFSPNIQALSQPTQLITPSWPFERWGINIMGLLTTTQVNYKFAVVVVEYVTKWVEAKPLVNIAATRMKRFFMVEHNMSVRSTQRDNSRQCQAIRLSFIQRVLLPDGGQSSLRARAKGKRIDIHNH
jgi:hypothetical protein